MDRTHLARKIPSLERTLFDLLLALIAIMLVLEYTRFELKARVPDSPATTTSDAESPEHETEATAWDSSEVEECPGQQRERGCGREHCRACYADAREYTDRCYVDRDYDEYLEEMQVREDERGMDNNSPTHLCDIYFPPAEKNLGDMVQSTQG